MFHPSPKKWFPSTVTDAYKKTTLPPSKKAKKKRQKGTLDLHLPKKQVPAPRPISSLHPPAWNPRWWTPGIFGSGQGQGRLQIAWFWAPVRWKHSEKSSPLPNEAIVILTLVTLDISVVLQHDSITVSLNKNVCFFMLPSQQAAPWNNQLLTPGASVDAEALVKNPPKVRLPGQVSQFGRKNIGFFIEYTLQGINISHLAKFGKSSSKCHFGGIC